MKYNYGYNRPGDYKHLVVKEPKPLLEFLLANLSESRTKVKATLQGRGIKVDGKCVTQFDFLLQPGMKVAVTFERLSLRLERRYSSNGFSSFTTRCL